MYLLIRYSGEIIVEGVVLAKGRNRMRVAAAGFPDTIELRRSGQQWLTASRQPVEFDFLMSDNQSESAPSLSLVGVARANGAAGDPLIQ
jgi:hypothetical protein